MTYTIKSITPVLRDQEWVVRVRLQDSELPNTSRETFHGIDAHYTMHQAQIYSDSIRRELTRHLEEHNS